MATIKSMVKQAAVAMVLVLAATATTGCDDGFGGGYDAPMVGGYGPIDDDVFQAAADDWSDYIRE
ncbi:MAG: hypothetical protein U1D55_07775 [Phycisphaerae bacterium]